MKPLHTVVIAALFLLTACATPTPTAPTAIPASSPLPPFSAAQTALFYDGQIAFYATNPGLPTWYSTDEGADAVQAAKIRGDEKSVNDLPFTIETITDPLTLAFYYGYGSACVASGKFIPAECGDLTTQAIEHKYYDQNKAVPTP